MAIRTSAPRIRKQIDMTNTRREFLSAVSSAAALGVVHTQVGASETPARLGPASLAPARLAGAPLAGTFGIALVGLGAQSTRNVGPLLANHPVCRISALVSGDASKAQAYAKAWSIDRSHVYDYESFDRIVADDAIDIVYLAVPTGMHCELAVRAAEAGKHVFCESPMATDSVECRKMIDASSRHSRRLAVASAPLALSSKCFGTIASIDVAQTLRIDQPNSWRLDRALCGGGAVLQAGVDVLRTSRLWAGSDPVWIIAQETKTDARKFASLDESVTWTLGFANGTIAHGAVSLNYKGQGHLRVQGQLASLSSEFPSQSQWSRADQLLAFAGWIQGKPVIPDNRFNPLDAHEALQDVVLAEAIFRSIQERRQVQLG